MNCPVCNSRECEIFIEIYDVPVHCNILFESYNDAVNAPRSDIALTYCNSCNHVFNAAFNPDLMEYQQNYENSLHFSPHFQNYAENLAQRLISAYDLHNKQIVEIGCGKGEFLQLLCDYGNNSCTGFDPNFIQSVDSQQSKSNITFIKDFYSEKYSELDADFIVCRHVLEHIHEPKPFIEMLLNSTGNKKDLMIYFEVPNVAFTLEKLGIWDIIYEHFSYFSIDSIRYLFNLSGFDISNLVSSFNGQYISLDAIYKSNNNLPKVNTTQFRENIVGFTEKYNNKINSLKTKLASYSNSDKNVVLWGAGSKGVTFLNTLKATGHIKYIVDLNPRKLRKFIPGSGQQIIGPSKLKDCDPDVVILANGVYHQEVKNMLHDMDIACQLITL
ncbi:methyltransferase domain-containing protein [candidate division KSB1 bacterium]|nr:methyltransferase domain-containing protein [candidate division KSB1 bacterium]